MNTSLHVFMQGTRIGELSYDSSTQLWDFHYEPTWLTRADAFALSPAVPLQREPQESPQQRSNAVRIFFENLLPEGQALEDASVAFQISKANSFGLLRALGQETSGALEILSEEAAGTAATPRARHVSRQDISARIRNRPYPPFAVWDARVRLSIAGFQDKLAVLEEHNEWYLVDGRKLASTHLLKPEPIHKALAGMTTNERFCLALAHSLGIETAANRLEHVPEPVLIVERFDRARTSQGIERLHCIDGCQALGLPVGMKYEWPFGHGRDVRGIRDGASLPRFFSLIDRYAAAPLRERTALLQWAILQVLIGNVDAHAKNLSFFFDAKGLRLAPAYDLVCGVLYEQKDVDDTLAMAIGDGYEIRNLGAYDWARFAMSCRLPARLVAHHMTLLAKECMKQLSTVGAQVRAEGGDANTIERISAIIEAQIAMVLRAAPRVPRVVQEESQTE